MLSYLQSSMLLNHVESLYMYVMHTCVYIYIIIYIHTAYTHVERDR